MARRPIAGPSLFFLSITVTHAAFERLFTCERSPLLLSHHHLVPAMLIELQLANFVLVREERIAFCNGLNIVSGASGSGKTILVKALGLLSGDRASGDLIGQFGRRAVVEGFFRLDPERLSQALEAAAPLAPNADGELVALRVLDAGGENRCYLNGSAVTLQTFRGVMGSIMEITGQEGLSALSVGAERARLIDRYAGCGDLASDFASTLGETRTLDKNLKELHRSAAERRDRVDLLTFQIGEIDKLDLERGEIARLEDEHRLLGSLEDVQEALTAGRHKLYEGDESVADILGAVIRSLESLPIADESRIAECLDSLRKALAPVEEAAFSMRDIQEELNADPERLSLIDQRLSEINRVLVRYGPTEADLFAFRERIGEELQAINVTDEDLESLSRELDDRRGALVKIGRKLDRVRRRAGEKLAAQVNGNLGKLLMKEVRFDVVVDDADWNDLPAAASASGPGRVRFMAATNPGTKPAPVEKIASGGERSRILLALLSALGRCCGTPSMTFDEIDENVGSRLGGVMGDLLAALSENVQVIAVTHIPAVAARGEKHNKVEKSIAKKATTVAVRALEGTERVQELAEMIAGPSPSKAAVDEAERILASG